MNTLTSERTPHIIAAEINTIRNQTRKIVLTNAIEIGRRLKEAKDLIPHGQWGKWLKESVSYSQSTAERLMQLFKEYGPRLLSSFDEDGNPNSAPVRNLTYTQALILLGLPEEERDTFITEHDVESMSKSELQQAIRDRDQALQEKKQALQEKENLQKDLNLKSGEITRLNAQTTSLEQQVQDYKTRYLDKEEKAPLQQTESDKGSGTMKADAQFHLHRSNMVRAYDELLKMLTALARTDPELKEKYRQEAKRTLENMANTLQVWPPVIKTNLLIDQGH